MGIDLERLVSETLRNKASEILSAPARAPSVPKRRTGATRRTMPALLVLGLALVVGGVATAAYLASGSSARMLLLWGQPEGSSSSFALADISGTDASVGSLHSLKGTGPAIAASDDGSRLFVAGQTDEIDDAIPSSDTLQVIDAASGETTNEIALFTPGNDLQRLQMLNPLPRPTIVSSPAGDYVFVMQFTQGNEPEQTFSVGTVDVDGGRLLPQSVPMDGCGGSYSLVALGGPQVAAICFDTPRVMLITVSQDGGAQRVEEVDLDLPPAQATDYFGSPVDLNQPAGGAVMPGGVVRVVTLGGSVVDINFQSGAQGSAGNLNLPSNSVVTIGQVASAGSGQVVIGLRDLDTTDAVNSHSLALLSDSTDLKNVTLLGVNGSPVRFLASSPSLTSVFAITEDGALLRVNAEVQKVSEVDGLPDGQLLAGVGVEPSGE